MWLIVAFVGIPLFGATCLALGFAIGVMAEYRWQHRDYDKNQPHSFVSALLARQAIEKVKGNLAAVDFPGDILHIPRTNTTTATERAFLLGENLSRASEPSGGEGTLAPGASQS